MYYLVGALGFYGICDSRGDYPTKKFPKVSTSSFSIKKWHRVADLADRHVKWGRF